MSIKINPKRAEANGCGLGFRSAHFGIGVGQRGHTCQDWIPHGFTGKVTEAAPHFRKAVQLNPSDPGAHSNLGVAHLMLNSMEMARKKLAEACRPDRKYCRGTAGRLGADKEADYSNAPIEIPAGTAKDRASTSAMAPTRLGRASSVVGMRLRWSR